MSLNVESREKIIFQPKSSTELAFLAGYFDGEGCICVAGNSTHTLKISVKSADFSVLQRFVSAFGGQLHPVKRYKSSYRQIYTWEAGNGTAQHILRKLIPYLDAKRKQAELATMPRYTYNGLTKPMPDTEKLLRQMVFNCVKAQKWNIHGQS